MYFAPSNPAGTWAGPVFPQADIPALIQDPATGAVFLNPRKATSKWCYIGANPDWTTIPANGIGTFAFTPPIQDNNSGDLELIKLTSSSTGRFSVSLEDNVTQRKLMNGPVPNTIVFGNGRWPSTLFESIFIPASASLIANVADLSGGGNAIKLSAEGRRFVGCGPQQQLWQAFTARQTHPYWLTFDAGPEIALGAGGANGNTITRSMTVPSNADFECWAILDDSTLAADGTYATDYQIRIIESQSGRSLILGPGVNNTGRMECKQFVAASSFNSGTVAGIDVQIRRPSFFPHTWTFTHLFKRGTSVIIELTNPAGVGAQTIRLALHGRLIYYNECPGIADPDRARMLQAAMIPMPMASSWLPCNSAPAPAEPIPGILPASAPTKTAAPAYVPPPPPPSIVQNIPGTNVTPGQVPFVLNPWQSPGTAGQANLPQNPYNQGPGLY